MGSDGPAELQIEEVGDEREPFGQATLGLLGETFPRPDRHSIADMEKEIQEKRLELLTLYDFHMLGARAEGDEVAAMGAGVYLAGVNAGLVMYLAVRPGWQGKKLGRRIRAELVSRFRENAVTAGWEELSCVLGEVRLDNPWIERLVSKGGVIPFDLDYYHPGMVPGETEEKYVLYREPVADRRLEIPATELRQILYSVFRRGYRVSYPMDKAGFRAMLDEIADRESVGIHPAFADAWPGFQSWLSAVDE